MHPNLDAPTSVVVDASDKGVGAVLQQRVDCQWCSLSFLSRNLKPNETCYSTFDRELYLTVKHFFHFLEGNTSISTQITNHSHMSCPPPSLVIPLARYVTWTSSPNSQLTSREQTIVQLTLCLEPRWTQWTRTVTQSLISQPSLQLNRATLISTSYCSR